MLLTIDNKNKLEIFVSVFQLLKNWGSGIKMQFDTDKLYIQTMDKSHICLADINIKANWFSKYEANKSTNIYVDSNNFAILMNYAVKNDILELNYKDDCPDKIFINCLNGQNNNDTYDHFFELNLIEMTNDCLDIPNVDYDVEFNIDSKKFIDSLTDLNTFGPDLNIKCLESLIELNTNSETTLLKIAIPIDDLNEYATTEEELDMNISLSHITKMCTSNKLSKNIEVRLSNEYPMMMVYNLGDDSNVCFFIAPKID